MTKPGRPTFFVSRASALPMLASVVLLSTFLLDINHPVRAEVRVDGEPGAIHLEAHAATVREVIAALGAAFKLRYAIGKPLDQAIGGTYRGTLPRVISRVLQGHDYVLKTGKEGAELVVYGAGGDAPASPYGAVPVEDVAGATRTAVRQLENLQRALSMLPK